MHLIEEHMDNSKNLEMKVHELSERLDRIESASKERLDQVESAAIERNDRTMALLNRILERFNHEDVI